MKTMKYALLGMGLVVSLSLFSQKHAVDINKSTIDWNGKKVSGEHYGQIQFKEGWFTVENNKIVNGQFWVDMTSMDNEDLTNPEWNKKLMDHLKSDDFFGVDKYPVSTLVLTSSTPFENGKAEVKGNLTIKGETHPVSFITSKTDAGYTASLTIDRTKYNIRYGSGKFFDSLGDNMIYDDFTLDVKIVTQ